MEEGQLPWQRFWEKMREADGYMDYEFPKVSVIIGSYNCMQTIAITIEHVLMQDYPSFEVVVVDGGSTDRTIDVVKSYRDERIQLHAVSNHARYEMVNKGISHATGDYFNFLFPGDFYVHRRTLKEMMRGALDSGKPHLIFCGTLLRDGKKEPKILLRPLSRSLLTRGQQPTSLQSCWFRRDTFMLLGKFDTSYSIRGGYELMCRYVNHPGLQTVSVSRVLTDYDLRHVTLEMVALHFKETFRTIWRHFGFWATVKWLWIQRDFYRICRIWWRSLKAAFAVQ